MRNREKPVRFGVEGLERRDTPGSVVASPGTIRGFDPQPDPPAQVHVLVNPQTIRGFNPQPEPPVVHV